MQTPIKVIVVSGPYYTTAIIPDHIEATGYESNWYEAICSALAKAGMIEIIDIEELRQKTYKSVKPPES